MCPHPVQTLMASLLAVLYATAAKHAEWIIQFGQSVLCGVIPAVGQKPIGLKQTRWTNKLIRIPPKRRTSRGTTSTQDTYIEHVQLGAFLARLQPLNGWRGRTVMQIRPAFTELLLKWATPKHQIPNN